MAILKHIASKSSNYGAALEYLIFKHQRQNLKELAEKYTSIRRKDYLEWRIRLEDEMTKAEEK